MIDLKTVIEKYPESLNSAEKLRAYLTDLYPNEKAKVGIVVSIFSCGIAEEIERSEKIDDVTIERFCTRLENDYGYSQKRSSECIDLWLDVYGKEVIKPKVTSYIKNTSPSQKTPTRITNNNTTMTSNFNNSVYAPAKNVQSQNNNQPSVKKNISDVKKTGGWIATILSSLIYVAFFNLYSTRYPEYEYNNFSLTFNFLYILAPLAVLVLGIIFCVKNSAVTAGGGLIISSIAAIAIGFLLLLGTPIVMSFLDYSDASEEVYEYYKKVCLIGLRIDVIVNTIVMLLTLIGIHFDNKEIQ